MYLLIYILLFVFSFGLAQESVVNDFLLLDSAYIFANNNGFSKINAGYLSITSKGRLPALIYTMPHILPEEFSLNMNVKFDSSSKVSSYGVIIGDTAIYAVVFKINAANYYKLQEYNSGKITDISDWQKLEYLNTFAFPNLINIENFSDGLKFSINTKQIRTFKTQNKFYKYGVTLSMNSALHIDYISLKNRKQVYKAQEQSRNPSKPLEKRKKRKLNQKTSLGNNINSIYNESACMLSPDGKNIFVTRKRHPENRGTNIYDDVWYSKLDSQGNWERLQNIGFPINNIGNNHVVSVSADNRTLYLLNTYNQNGEPKSGGISKTRLIDNKWTIPEDVNVLGYNNINQFSTFNISADESIMTMSMENQESIGGLDLYVSFKTGNNQYTKPLNLGRTINTIENDFNCFLAADNQTFYFSTLGRDGFGSADIYFSKRLDSTWQNWSEPQNLGEEINSASAEIAFAISYDGDYAYLVTQDSTISIGGTDIVKVKLPNEAKPNPVAILNTNSSFDSLIVRNKANNEIILKVNKQENKTLTLPLGQNYQIEYKKDGKFVSEDVNLDKSEVFEVIEGKKSEIENDTIIVYFDYKNWKAQIEEIAITSEVKKVNIYTYSDMRGTDKYNNDLTMKRSKFIESRLIKKTQKGKIQFNIQSYGKLYANLDCESENCFSKDRKAVVILEK